MTHIIINDISQKVYIYDGQKLRKEIEYKDNFFLREFNDYDVCYISPDGDVLSACPDKCLVGWKEKMNDYLELESPVYYWFMDSQMRLISIGDIETAKEDYLDKKGSHVFIGCMAEGARFHYSLDEFCKLIIEAFFPKQEVPNIDGQLTQELSSIKRMMEALSEKMDIFIQSSGESKFNENDIVRSLKEEIAQYRNDFYFKSVQRQGLDAILEVYENMCIQLYNARTKEDSIKNTIQFGLTMIERALKTAFHVKLVRSQQGVPFDEETMTPFSEDCVETDDPNLKKCVAFSVIPGIIWTIPRVNSTEREFLYKEECVALYI